jgi:hypothetical protein
MEVGREGPECAYRLGITVGRDGRDDFGTANIETSGIGMDAG